MSYHSTKDKYFLEAWFGWQILCPSNTPDPTENVAINKILIYLSIYFYIKCARSVKCFEVCFANIRCL